MSKSKSTPAEPVVGPRFIMTGLKPVDIVDQTSKKVDAIKANPKYLTSPVLQAAVTTWLADSQVIGTEDAAVHATRAALKSHLSLRSKGVSKWKRSTKKVLAEVNDLAGGDPAAVNAWGFDTATRMPVATSGAAPENLRVSYSK